MMSYIRIRDSFWLGFIITMSIVAAGCGGNESTIGSDPKTPASKPPPISDKPKIIAYGDSLTSGFGLDSWEKSYPALLQKRLDAAGFDFQVLNYGFPGDTSERGLARLYLATGIVNDKIFVIELGANDIMKGVPADEIRRNLSEMIKRLKDKGIEVILCGFKAPETAGTDNQVQIDSMYRDLASTFELTFIPDFMEGVSGNADLMQPDGIHPNESGVRFIEERVSAALVPLLEKYVPKKN
ncbi:MAG: arylesterase [Pyrinomonadaceae bacterium]|nr:arylesterase [Pyrinomonadaceae bacterium]